MSAMHTPGPWLFRDHPLHDLSCEVFIDFEGDVLVIATTHGGTLPLGEDEPVEENARLIAAAPDLLAALEAVWREGVIPDGYALLQDQVSDAIAKATGGVL